MSPTYEELAEKLAEAMDDVEALKATLETYSDMAKAAAEDLDHVANHLRYGILTPLKDAEIVEDIIADLKEMAQY